jgi:23S rRNA (cytidine1920-2'-O)/16S rRNA (cytidine1409-2'-O)-methyltransferase
VVVADLSFISLATVAPALLGPRTIRPGGEAVILVKPQFEAGRAEVSKGRGVVRDPAVWRRVLGEARSALTGQGAAMMGVMVSPLKGADGNVEFLAHLRASSAGGMVDDARLDAVVAEAEGP